MKLITDKPIQLRDPNFICMGFISDSDKDYACILQINDGKLYIEEIHWGFGKNINTATLHQVDNDREWISLYDFVSSSTTIFSPRKVKAIRKNPDFYFYSDSYKKSKDYESRTKKGI